jgi:fucose permease
MTLDLFSLLGTYAAGSCRALKSSIYIWVLVFGVFLYVGIHTLVSTKIVSITIKEKVKRLVTWILSKFAVVDGQKRQSFRKKGS